MATDKKSVLLYCDIIHTVDKLDDAQAGRLFKHYLRYINDLEPKSDTLTEIVFEPIKQSLKRDLKKWEVRISQRSNAGKISAGKKAFDRFILEKKQELEKLSPEEHLREKEFCLRKQSENHGTYMFYFYKFSEEYHQQMATKSTSVESVELKSTKSTVSVSDSVSVSVSDSVILLEKETKDILPRFNFLKNLKELGVEEGIIKEWLSVRKKKKSTNTETAFKKIKKEIEKSGLTANEAIKTSVENSWAGFNHSWIERISNKPNTIKTASSYSRADAIAKLQKEKNGK